MSTSERASSRGTAHIRAAITAMGVVLVALASCTLAPDHCLRMSDCGDGTACVDGLCATADFTASVETDASPTADATPSLLLPAPDATVADASSTHEAGADAASDAGDGAVTDATSD